ncbi:MAG TPA: Na/Pi symporter, partial [Elusimicrobiales bacterium]|nr:Na/Pi symporter [Elusimicrobiales bacterium]
MSQAPAGAAGVTGREGRYYGGCEVFDAWSFFAGLGMFLFGMFMLEESIKALAGRSLKTLIRRFTGTRGRALLTGIATTSVLQSSSAVGLMAMAFVGAGMLALSNALATLLGAMVGTTGTAWIVAFFGFSVKIDHFALPLVGLGGLGLVLFGGSPRWTNAGKLLFAFGLLFLGLDYMKKAAEVLAAGTDLSALPDLGLWLYALTGLVLTAIMQSSSASIAVVLTAVFGGLIDFRQAAGMVIGANVGSVVPLLLVSIGGIPAKKQTALGSLALKTGTALIVMPALPLLTRAVEFFVDPAASPTLAVAAFHTLFNLVAVAFFYPAIPPLARRLKAIFPERRTVLARFIPNASPQVPEAALHALRNEVLNQLSLSLRYTAGRYGLTQPTPEAPEEEEIHYYDLERLHAEIFAFYAQVQSKETEEVEALQLEPVIRASRSVMNATRNFYDLRGQVDDFASDENEFLAGAGRELKERLAELRDFSERLARMPEGSGAPRELDTLFRTAEEADRRFISSCAEAVAGGAIRKGEVTRLLMANRLFTQSARMIVLSLKGLSGDPDPS